MEKALYYYKMAAEKNDTGAMSNLATLYLHMTDVSNYE
jgi:TPR repeat protein